MEWYQRRGSTGILEQVLHMLVKCSKFVAVHRERLFRDKAASVSNSIKLCEKKRTRIVVGGQKCVLTSTCAEREDPCLSSWLSLYRASRVCQ